jgi:hypothetical protein
VTSTLSVSSPDPAPRQATVTWTAPVLSDPGTDTVTGWTITANPGGRVRNVTDPNVRAAVFDNLTSNKTYTFTLEAQVDDGVSPTTVEAGTLTAYGWSLGASVSRKKIASGGSVRFHGALVGGQNKKPRSGQNVLIQTKLKGTKAGYHDVATVKTGKKGVWSKTLKPRYSSKYRALYTGNGMGSWTAEYDVTVVPVLSIGFSANPIKLGSKVVIRGSVVKGNVKKLAGSRVTLQRLQKGKWKGLRDLKISPKGRFHTRFQPGNGVDYKYRWQTGGGPRYGNGVSPGKTLYVN